MYDCGEYEYPGGAFTSTQKDSRDGCKEECKKEKCCAYYVWNYDNKNCELKPDYGLDGFNWNKDARTIASAKPVGKLAAGLARRT
jgi:hypothetical protein